MKAIMPEVSSPAGSQDGEGAVSWGSKMGYKAASMEEMRTLAALPFLTFPGAQILSKSLSAVSLPRVCSQQLALPRNALDIGNCNLNGTVV